MNVLLMGAGWIAEMVYLPFLVELDVVKCIYVFDVNANLMEDKFLSSGKVSGVDEEDLLLLQYEFVFILTPNSLHCSHLLRFVDKESTIFVEKPACINPEEAEVLGKLEGRQLAGIYVSTPFRYREDMRHVRNIIQSSILGNIYRVEIAWLKRRGAPGSDWFVQREQSGGGVLIDMGPHMLDLFYWLLGERVAKHCLGAKSSFFLEAGDAYADWHKAKNSSLESNVEDSSFNHLIYDDMSLGLNLVWASNIENDYAQIKLYGDKAALDVFTSFGFSTNVLYQETRVNLIKEGKSSVDILPIEEGKAPFHKMLNDIFLKEKLYLADMSSALHVMQDIFNLYRGSFAIEACL